MKKLRWGILSTAKIGVQQVIPAMQQGEWCEVVAIGSRDLGRAEAAAAALGIPRAHGSYEALLADDQVDAIYNPLPNHMHVPMSIRALEAGKHVLCEKPLALTADEAQKLLDAAAKHPQLKAMEAFMYRHHPQWRRAAEIVAAGGVGRLRTIHSFFSYYKDDPSDIRSQVETGGGGLMDIGCYCISLARLLFQAEPGRVMASIEIDDRLGVDRMASGVLEFAEGTATFTCGMQLAPYQRVNIFGTEGRVEIEIPFNAPPDAPCKMWREREGSIEEITLDVCDQYTIQGDLFARAVLDNTPVPTPLADGVANMRVIERCRESARDGKWA